MNPISFSLFKPGAIAPNVPSMIYNYYGGVLPNLTANEVILLGITQAFNPTTYASLSEFQNTKTANNYVTFTDVSEPTKISDTFQRFIYGYNNPNIAALATSNPATGGTAKYSRFESTPSYLEGISNTTDFDTWSTPVKFPTPNFKTVYAYSATPPVGFQNPTGTETAEAIGIVNGLITDQYAMVVPMVAATKNYWESEWNPQTGQQTKIQADTIGGLGVGNSGFTPFFKTTDGINYQYVRSGYPTALNIVANAAGTGYPTDMVINNIPVRGGDYLDVEGNTYAGRNAVIDKVVFHKPGTAINVTITDPGEGINHPMLGNSFQMFCFVPAPAGTGNLPIVYSVFVQGGVVSASQQITCAGAGFTSNIVNQEIQHDIYGEAMNWVTGSVSSNQNPVQPQNDMSQVTFGRKPKITINVNPNYAMIRSILWKDSGDGYSTFPTISQSNSTRNRNFNITAQNLGMVSWSSVSAMRPNMPDGAITYNPSISFPANIFQDNYVNVGDPLAGVFSPNNKGDIIVIPKTFNGGAQNDLEIYGISPTVGPTNRKNKSTLAGSVIICDNNLTNVTVINHPLVTVQAKPPSEFQQFPGAPAVKPNTAYFANTPIPESQAYISITYAGNVGYSSSMGGVYSTGIDNNLYVTILKSYGSYNATDSTLSEYKYRFEVWHLQIGDNVFVDESDVVWTKMFNSSEFTSNIAFSDFGYGGMAICSLSLDAKLGAGQRATEMLATFQLITFNQMTGQQSYVANESKLFTLSDEKTAVEVSNPSWTTHMGFDELNNRYSRFVVLTAENRSSLALPSAPSADGRYIMLMGTGQRVSTGSQTVTWVTETTHLDPFAK